MTEQTEHRVVLAGDLWTLTPHENRHHPQYWLSRESAQEYADYLNRIAALTSALRSALGVFATVGRTQMGGGRMAWQITFPQFDTIDGPYLLLTDDTSEFYDLGIYDARQEVPNGPEPIIEQTAFRVEAVAGSTRHQERHPVATPREVAMFVRDRARFVLGLTQENE